MADTSVNEAQLVLCEEDSPGVVTLTLNDPSKRNAMGEEMAGVFSGHLQQLVARDDLRLVVVRGAGGAFSAGGDLKMLRAKSELSESENTRRMLEFYRSFLRIYEVPAPVIAAINGHAVGAGLCFTLACDIRVAQSRAKLGLNFVRLGLHPGMGVTYFLPRIVGPARAAELLYSGRILSAGEAAEIGLVNKVCEEDSFDRALEELKAEILSGGPQAQRALKKSLQSFSPKSLDEVLDREAKCQANDYAGPQFLEGINAAIEKRTARFVS